MKALKELLESKGYQPVRLMKIFVDEAAMYHFLVEAELNGVEGYFIVDSGATSTVVDAQKAEKFGLEAPEIQPEIQAMGASPDELDIRFAGFYPVRIKKWKGKSFPVMMMDIDHITGAMEEAGWEVDGILGADVLHAGKAVLDYGKQRMFLKKKRKKKKKKKCK